MAIAGTMVLKTNSYMTMMGYYPSVANAIKMSVVGCL